MRLPNDRCSQPPRLHHSQHPIAMRYVTEIPSMPRGRTPEGEHTLSNAERQARYRARREADQPPPAVRYRRPVDRRSRSRRWNDLVAGLLALQAEYAAWYDVFRIISATPPPPQLCRPSLIWISMNSSPSCRRGGSDAIDRPRTRTVHQQLRKNPPRRAGNA